MGLRIKTNMESVIAQNRFSSSRNEITDSLEKLSSGKRINRAADDAAGLAVSEALRARTIAMDVAKRNANDAISMVQVTEGGLNEVTNITVRMRELAMQAASDTVGNRERGFLNKEFQQLRQEVVRIMDTTEFNGAKVLRPESTEKPIQIFVGSSNRGSDADGNAPDIDPENDSDILNIDLSDLVDLTNAMDSFRTSDVLSIVPESADGGAPDLGSAGTNEIFRTLDDSLSSIASYRASLGAFQSRLNSTVNNLDIASENLTAAQSRIRDVDYAKETARYAQARILTSAGASVLAQANTTPEVVLQLLR